MTIRKLKLFIAALFAVSLVALTAYNFTSVQAVSNAPAPADAAADYKAKCAMCHSPKAEKAFDPAKSVEHHTEIILKGKKDAKPPMPGYESKGMTAEQAKALAEYMLSLRKPADSTTDTKAAEPKENGDNKIKLDEQLAATYKAKCAMCHSPKAEKAFDTSKKDEVLAEIVLKGVKDSKPPMPGYESKGMKADEALALVGYMRGLRDAKK